MAWTTPRTWATNELVTAALLNEQLRDNLNILIALVPTGTVVPYAGINLPTNLAPASWLFCDGSAVSRTTYAALFSAVGTSFGSGDGSTTFNLPDLRGRFPLAKDNLGGTSANRVTAAAADQLGGSGGEENHTLTITEMPAHSHNIIGSTNSSGGSVNYWPGNSNSGPGSFTQGGNGGHNNMPPYLALNYIIKT